MSKVGGYMGRILRVGLSTGNLTEQRLPEALLRAFVGGYGLGARILYEQMGPGADALGPENILGFVTGPLTGTPAVMASRYCIVGKSPLTGTWGDANSGGEFGPALKFAGYDAVFFDGLSRDPVYLLVDDGQARLQPAGDLWGLDAVETERALQARHGTDLRVASIGPAGERLSRISCVINDGGRAAGRSGLGAVMGAKRLKAVAVRGDQKPGVANPERVRALRREYLPLFKTDGEAEVMRNFGTPGYTKILLEIGRTPVKNWRGSYPQDFGNADSLDGPAVVSYEQKKYACWHCVQVCGGLVRWEVDGQARVGHKPEYETLATMGTYCGIDDLNRVMTLNEMCNRAGLDTISAGATIAFAMECYEHGLFDDGVLDGLELTWGNGGAAIDLLQRMIDRQGVGDLLADGVRAASQRLGSGSEAFAIHAGGQELPAHDPRHEEDFGLSYQLAPTPGRHTQGGVGALQMPPEALASFGLEPGLADSDPLAYHAQAYAAVNAWRNMINAAGLCAFGADIMPPENVPQFLAAVTGWDCDMAECIRAGERVEVMRHAFNLREGHNPLEVEVASRAMGRPPLESGPTAGISVEVDELRAAYLAVMDWDPETTMPSKERLEALGLDKLVGTSQD